MDNPVVIVGFIVVAAAVFYFVLQKFLGSIKETDVERRVADIDDRRVTPNGLNLWVEDIANVTEPEIRAIEKGLEDCFVKARAIGYTHPLKLSDYIVAIIGDSVRAPESGGWCFKLPANNYAGTKWDLGGYILAAGQALNDRNSNTIVLPDHQGTDLEDLATVTTYEAEHLILRASDPAKFDATSTHGPTTSHPLF